ncbi:ABC transporter ATP-binding protein [Anaerostipes caccae]|uniref:ABC transporter ATP-binding protein n=1 Tax=Anaerostipes caccae TaxID=105841 RepID=UPI00101B71FC|nr:ABC transporter ATP-binding protein [Anaerostipes caccae]
MITIDHITKKFGQDKVAVKDAAWTIPDGAITGFIGPNGAGKTTTLKMITGVLKPDAGQILINGMDIVKQPVKAKEQFGFVSDTPDNFLRLKGIEYLNFMGDVYEVPVRERTRFITTYANRFGIEQVLGDKILSYSHGMRQKEMIMGALIHSPSVWILDEPMTGLDPQASFELKKMMREHADSGKSVLFSTHVLEVAEKLCDQVVMICKGKIQFQGTLDQLESKFPEDTDLETIFMEMTWQ